MKTLVLTLVIFLFISFSVQSQCNYPQPEIVPQTVLICPESTDTLSTTEKYDTYQWIKNGKPVAGATQPFLVITYYDDTPSFFKVAVTKNGCKDTSKRRLADGYIFAGPVTISEGETGVYDPKKDATIQCPGDTVKLTFGDPYTENIQWYNNYQPLPGAHKQSYLVTQSGSFTQCGAPAACPNYIVCQNIPVNFYYQKPTAAITKKGDTLFASKASGYQWYYFNLKINGATKNYVLPEKNGAYMVRITDKYTCSDLSRPFIYTSAFNSDKPLVISPNPATSLLHVKLQLLTARQLIITDVFGTARMVINLPQEENNISIQSLQPGNYFLQVIGSNKELLKTVQFTKQ